MLKMKQLSSDEQKSAQITGFGLTFLMLVAQILVFIYVESIGGFDIPAEF